MPGRSSDREKGLNMWLPGDQLHQNLGGSFPRGSLMMVEGPDTTGKSALMQRLTHGFLRNNVSVTYISTELTVKDFIDQMYSLNYPIAHELIQRQLVFFPVYTIVHEVVGREDFLEKLMNSPSLYRTDVTIIDCFSSLVRMSIGGPGGGPINVLGFFKKLAAMDKFIIFTIEPTALPPDVINMFRTDVGIYLSLALETVAGSSVRVVQIRRFLNALGPLIENFAFRVEPNVGFVLEITAVS